MQLLKKRNGALALATGLIIVGGGSFAPAAHASWLKNPFAKPADVPPPPPGMSDTEDANGNPVAPDTGNNTNSDAKGNKTAASDSASQPTNKTGQNQTAGKADSNGSTTSDAKKSSNWASRDQTTDQQNDTKKDHWYTPPWRRNAAKLDNPPPGMKEDAEQADNMPSEMTNANHPETEQARKNLQSTYRSHPDLDTIAGDPDLHLRMARTLLAKQRYKEALSQVNEALKLNSDMWEARYLGAYIFQLEGRSDEALVKYKQYLAVKPDDQQAHINLGILLKRAGKFDEAEDQYRKAIDINFSTLEAHYNLANLYIEKNRLENALKELLVCAKIAPTNAMVHNNLGVIYQKRDYLEEAAEEFSKAANLEPANHTFTLNLDLVRDQLVARKKQGKALTL
jgi:Flp pilus assembly protein TadD